MAVDPAELIGGPDRPGLTPTLVGRVKFAPYDASSGMTITLESFGQDYPFEVAPGHWAARPGLLPGERDWCGVFFDDRGDVWVAVWAPSENSTVDEASAGGGGGSMPFFLAG